MNNTTFSRKEKRVFVAHNISESMFINSGHDFEQYYIVPQRATFEELKKVVEDSESGIFLKNLICNKAVLNRIKEMYQIDIPINSREREKIALQPGDVLYTVSPVERLTLKLYEESTNLPAGIRLKLIKYSLTPRVN